MRAASLAITSLTPRELAHVGRLKHGQDPAFRPEDQVPTVYAQVKGDVPETFDVFLGSVAPSGYAWIIPKGPGLRMWVGRSGWKTQRRPQRSFGAFCADLNLEIVSFGGGWIPMGGPSNKWLMAPRWPLVMRQGW